MQQASYFLTLFTRGRYVTSRSIAHNEAIADNPKRKHAERERFAVAAIAFCYQHNKRFREYFLRTVAALKPGDVNSIDVEPVRWGDLILEGKRDVIVLEFKLKALLAEHQDPNAKGRLLTQSGYGAAIVGRYAATCKRLRYVIVGKDIPAGRTSDGLEFHSIPWSKFIRRFEKESALQRDLFDCLGTLGAPVLLSRRMKKKAPTNEANGALEVYQLLTLAADTIPTGEADSGPNHVGLNLSSRSAVARSLHEALINVVHPLGRSLGWIGYERREEFENKLCLSVWFYCSSKGKKSAQKKLQELRGTGGKIVIDEDSVGFLQPAVRQSDHRKWIAVVLQCVAAKSID
jgi:hypothetical protein